MYRNVQETQFHTRMLKHLDKYMVYVNRRFRLRSTRPKEMSHYNEYRLLLTTTPKITYQDGTGKHAKDMNLYTRRSTRCTLGYRWRHIKPFYKKTPRMGSPEGMLPRHYYGKKAYNKNHGSAISSMIKPGWNHHYRYGWKEHHLPQ